MLRRKRTAPNVTYHLELFSRDRMSPFLLNRDIGSKQRLLVAFLPLHQDHLGPLVHVVESLCGILLFLLLFVGPERNKDMNS